MFIQSKATRIEVDPSTPPPIQIELGKKFDIPPRVRVLDENSRPVSDATVVAFSWPEPKFSGS